MRSNGCSLLLFAVNVGMKIMAVSPAVQGNNSTSTISPGVIAAVSSVASLVFIAGCVITPIVAVAVCIGRPCLIDPLAERCWKKKETDDPPDEHNKGNVRSLHRERLPHMEDEVDAPEPGPGNATCTQLIDNTPAATVISAWDNITSPSGKQQYTKTGVLKFAVLCRRLRAVAANWFIFGSQLGVDSATLGAIDQDGNQASMIFFKILLGWLQNNKVPHTKEKLVEIIASPAIGNNYLAGEIEKDKNIPATFEEGSVNLLHGKLSNHLAANYHSFGIQLGFTLDEIGAFAKHKVPVKDKLESMLNEWVESGAVDRDRLGKDLREEWSNYTTIEKPDV